MLIIKSKLSSIAKIPMFIGFLILTLAACSGSSGGGSDSNAGELNEPPISSPGVLGFGIRYFSGQEVSLTGITSFDSDGMIVSYRWTQRSGSTQVVLSGADEMIATFTAPANLTPETYVFQLEVEDDSGAVDLNTLDLLIEPSVRCTSCDLSQINVLNESGNTVTERSGQVVAIDDAVLAIPNQVTNEIEFLDLANGTIQKKVQLTSAPDLLYYQSSSRFLYASLIGTTAIARINIDSDEVLTFPISGLIESLTGGDNRVYYSLQNQWPRNELYSLGLDGNEQLHGLIDPVAKK